MVSEAATDSSFQKYLRGLWREVAAAVPAPPGVDLQNYTDRLLERFRNPGIRHRTWQIAMDGSQKLPQRLLGSLRDRRALGLNSPHLALAVAGWMRYVSGRGEHGEPIDVRDPFAAELKLRALALPAEAAARRLLGFKPVFGEDFAGADGDCGISAMYEMLLARGVKQAINSLAA